MIRLLFIGVVIPIFGQGQVNLVPNGDFEEYLTCPSAIGQIDRSIGWMTPTGGTPDYFRTCCPPNEYNIPTCGVPVNSWGTQNPKSGEAYAGVYCFNLHMSGPPYNGAREYLQTELIESLQAGVRYEVSFYASVADSVVYAVRTLGVHFSTEPVGHPSDQPLLDVTPQVLNQSGVPITDAESWVLVTDTFRSRYGGERYITIGNFHSDADSDTLRYKLGWEGDFKVSYYYIDDVSVIALDSIVNSYEESLPLGFNIYPNPAQDAVRIVGTHSIDAVRVRDMFGREVLRLEPQSDQITIKLNDFPQGMYQVTIIGHEGQSFSRNLVIQ